MHLLNKLFDNLKKTATLPEHLNYAITSSTVPHPYCIIEKILHSYLLLSSKGGFKVSTQCCAFLYNLFKESESNVSCPFLV